MIDAVHAKQPRIMGLRPIASVKRPSTGADTNCAPSFKAQAIPKPKAFTPTLMAKKDARIPKIAHPRACEAQMTKNQTILLSLTGPPKSCSNTPILILSSPDARNLAEINYTNTYDLNL